MKFDIKNMVFGIGVMVILFGTFGAVLATLRITDTGITKDGAPFIKQASCFTDSGGGGDYTTIQECLDYASSGGIVFVKKGTYSITADITLNKSNTKLLCEKGTTIFSSTAGTNMLYIYGVKNISVQDCNFQTMNKTTSAIRVTDSSDVLLTGNTFTNIGYNGVVISGASKFVKVIANTFNKCSEQEQDSYSCIATAATSSQSTIALNSIYTENGVGIDIRGYNEIVSDNVINNVHPANHGIYSNAFYAIIKSNNINISGGNGHGMYLLNGIGLNVNGNSIISDSLVSHGFKVDNVNDTSIQGNNVKGGVVCYMLGANTAVKSLYVGSGSCYGYSNAPMAVGAGSTVYSGQLFATDFIDINENQNGILLDIDANGDDTKQGLKIDYSGTGDYRGLWLQHNGDSTDMALLNYSLSGGTSVPLKIQSIGANSMIRIQNDGTGSHIRFTGSGTPASPAEGDLWYDLSNHVLKFRDNAGTKIINMSS